MGFLLRLVRSLFRGLIRVAVFLLALAVMTLAPGDEALFPAGHGEDAVRVVVIDHGYHSGLVVPVGALWGAATRLEAEAPELAARLRWLAGTTQRAPFVEIGWGDAAFYQATPGIGDVQAGLALEAVFLPTPSAVQVVPVWGPPELAFGRAEQVALTLGQAGFDRLAARLAETLVPGDPAALGPSLYGAGQFFPASPSYHGLMTCNHWTSWLLRGAGVPSSWFLSTTSAGLMAELRWRAL